MRKLLITSFLVFLFGFQNQAQSLQQEKMQWFGDAKLGIFIHWGIYAVDGIDESWSFYNGYISHQNYMKQLNGFTAQNYDPKTWVKLFVESGAKYAVITSKHHDGVALWDSKFGELNVVDKTPAGRDLISPLVRELRRQGLKTGLYFSLLDWSHPDYCLFPFLQGVNNCSVINDSYNSDLQSISIALDFSMSRQNNEMLQYPF